MANKLQGSARMSYGYLWRELTGIITACCYVKASQDACRGVWEFNWQHCDGVILACAAERPTRSREATCWLLCKRCSMEAGIVTHDVQYLQ